MSNPEPVTILTNLVRREVIVQLRSAMGSLMVLTLDPKSGREFAQQVIDACDAIERKGTTSGG